jgi:hypothetical protein
MDRPSKAKELIAAWRALDNQTGDGWATIPLLTSAGCAVRAGRHFPGNEEALLVGFKIQEIPRADRLPQGRGFSVSRVDTSPEWQQLTWLCLARRPSAEKRLFAAMATNVVESMEGLPGASEPQILQMFLGRVRAWQVFMQRNADVLTDSEEIGLFGELLVLQQIICSGVPPCTAVEAWRGPVDGLHDFVLGAGAIEVKTTLSDAGFMARIGSLDQLDTTLVTPLFLAAVRLQLSSTGKSLPEKVQELHSTLYRENSAQLLLDELLITAGYIEALAECYRRRFECADLRMLAVAADFPKLTRSSVPIAIREAHYTLDIDQVTSASTSLHNALAALGAI